MRLDHGDWELDSDVHWAPSRTLAEQLAALALLDELAALELHRLPPAGEGYFAEMGVM